MKEPKLVEFKNNTESVVSVFSATGNCVRFQPDETKEVIETMFKACVKEGLTPIEGGKAPAEKKAAKK